MTEDQKLIMAHVAQIVGAYVHNHNVEDVPALIAQVKAALEKF